MVITDILTDHGGRVVMALPRLRSCQVRAARAMLGYSIARMARESQVSESSIRRAEQGFGPPKHVTLDLLERLHVYFNSIGFIFTWNGSAPGVIWNGYMGSTYEDEPDPSGGPI